MEYLSDLLKFLALASTVGCVVAGVVLLWPGALAAVTGFSLFGLSIASLVGPSLLSQIAAVAVLTTGVILCSGLLIDLTSGFVNLIKSCCSSKSGSKDPTAEVNPSLQMDTNADRMHQSLGAKGQKELEVPQTPAMQIRNPFDAKKGAPAEYSEAPAPRL